MNARELALRYERRSTLRSRHVAASAGRPSDAAKKSGSTLMETVLSLIIFASISTILAGTMRGSASMLRHQEEISSQGVASSTLRWIEEEIRKSDRVQIVSATSLQLSQGVAPPVNRTIRFSGSQLLLDQAGSTQVVSEPIQSLRFSDPSGRGFAVEIQLTGGDPNALTPVSGVRKIVALDWVR